MQGGGGSNFFQGGGGSNCLFPIETRITCDFPGGGPDPLFPPSGSALAKGLSIRLSVTLSPPKLLDEIQPNFVCELLT